MARRKLETEEETDDNRVINGEDEADYSDDTREELSHAESKIEELLTDLGGAENAEVKVYKQPGTGQSRMAYLFTCSPSDYSLGELMEKIKHEYGGGDYRIHIRQDNRILSNRQITIAEPKKTETGGESWRYQKEIEDMKRQREDDRFAMILDQMNNQQKATTDMFKLIIENNKTDQKDPIEMMSSMMAAMGQMQKMAGMDKQTDPYKELERILSIKDKLLGETSDREPTSGDLLLNAIKQFGPAFGKVLQNQGGQMPQLPGVQQNPTSQPTPETPAQPEAETSPQVSTEKVGESTAENAPALLQHLQVLMAAAARDGDPATYADLVLDFTDENSLAQLAAFISDENCFALIAQYYPAISEYQNWFTELRLKLLETIHENYPELLPEPESGIKEGPATGDGDANENDADNGDPPGDSGR